MNMKYRVVLVVMFLLVSLSMSLSVVNYFISLESTQKQLKNKSLPLTIDNIYTDIQKHIIQPNLVASMMAEDTFLKEWLQKREDKQQDIKEYLEAIKQKYGMFMTFLVSDKTKNYYTSKGFVEKIPQSNPANKWYYDLKSIPQDNEINLDHNENIDNSIVMFMNHKIFDDNRNMIGATGVGFKISYIDEMLKNFRVNYSFRVYFINEKGELVLYEREHNAIKNVSESKVLKEYKDKIINKKDGVLKLNFDSEDYFVNVKYIQEIDLYLIVEAKISNFTGEVKRVFYMNLLISFFVTLFIALLIVKTIHNYNNKLEYMATHDSLTNLPNRRSFNSTLKKLLLLNERQKNNLSLLFFDIDDFKKINDTSGHQIGDEVLKRVAEIIKSTVRETDLCARWGGEEFTVALIDSSIENAKIVSEKLRVAIESDEQLKELAGFKVTASFGITQVTMHDKISQVLHRVDSAMYKAKEEGKNRVYVL